MGGEALEVDGLWTRTASETRPADFNHLKGNATRLNRPIAPIAHFQYNELYLKLQ